MQIVFTEQEDARTKLLPLTYTRPIADLRVGILTIAEKWKKRLNATEIGFDTADYLAEKWSGLESGDDTLWIINGLLPDHHLIEAIQQLNIGEVLVKGDVLLAAKGSQNPLHHTLTNIPFEHDASLIERTWDIFQKNGAEIRSDFDLVTKNRKSQEIDDPHTIVYGSDLFIEEGASIKAATLNTESGPIYIGKGAEVQEGALIRGPFALGEHSTVNMGAKVRGDTSTGPHCKIGGEINNVLFWGYSSKAHDGFLGNAVIGEWCNIGADTNNSNLKNNYDPVRMWDYHSGRFIHTDLQFCGLIMADHSKCGINTMLNTGTTIGVACNIYGEGFPRNVIPSFAWGGASGFVTHQPRKAFITTEIVMKRRNLTLTDSDKAILTHIFESSAQYRVWEKNQ